MPVEAALIKPVVDALLLLFRQSSDLRLKRDAAAALREAIRELLLANPDENKAEARIAIAKAAGILSEDVVLAEDMLKKTRASRARTRGKSATGRKRKPSGQASGTATPKTAPKTASKTAKSSLAGKKTNQPAKKKAAKPATKKTPR
ncbi:hypothetical protein [Luteimonas vadosa]|uniref:Uncharacterized protein n=1 Tax=Luteimonas vadosa TaxID=1165507 RepID=A0ABP9DSQ4_9GAMM